MNIRTLNSQNYELLVKSSVEIIARGGLVIAPFDTVYGIMCDAANHSAVQRIFIFKQRPLDKPIGIAVNDNVQLTKYGKVNQKYSDFLQERIPGPYTFILESQNTQLSPLCLNNNTVGIRVPNSQFILKVIKSLVNAVAQTSANKSGQPNISSAQEIFQQFSPKEMEMIDLVIDGGEMKHAIASEIIDLTGNEPQKVERS